VDQPAFSAPDFVVAGHVTSDLIHGERRPGGTASYAAAVAVALGLRVAVVTSAPPSPLLPPEQLGAAVYRLPAADQTVMEHRTIAGRREQYLRSRAETLSCAELPPAVQQAPVVLFGPVVWEVETSFVRAFPRALRGATLQGWLRRPGANGHIDAVDPHEWDARALLPALDAAFLSEDDLALPPRARAALLNRWAAQVRLLAVTRGAAGADLAVGGRWYAIGAMPANEVDSTGAGDAFAAAFLIRYHEAADPDEAARFAGAVASFVVEAPGATGAPRREQALARMRANPAVRLRPKT